MVDPILEPEGHALIQENAPVKIAQFFQFEPTDHSGSLGKMMDEGNPTSGRHLISDYRQESGDNNTQD